MKKEWAEMVKTKCILTSTIGQQAAHTTDQLSFPSCSTTATYTKKPISQRKVLENMLERKLTQENGPEQNTDRATGSGEGTAKPKGN